MTTNLKRRTLLFKAKIQLANSSNGKGVDEWYNMKVNGQMHSEKVKNANLVREHLQTKEKTRRGGGG